MMWIALALVAGVAGGLWFAWSHGLGGQRSLDGDLGRLQSHFAAEGLRTDASLVRRGTWEGTIEHARFDLRDEHDRHFYVVRFATEAQADRQRSSLLAAASPSHPRSRGTLLLYLPDWPADDPLLRRVSEAFDRFDP